MHRVVIFLNPVVSNGEELYGRLYSGNTEGEILIAARADYKTLLIREQWEDEPGEKFRQQEGWTLTHSTDGSTTWWSYDKDRYTFYLGYDPIPDQFVKGCTLPSSSIALLSGWVPLKMAHTNMEDYIINQAFYYSVLEANPNDICWCSIDASEDDGIPF